MTGKITVAEVEALQRGLAERAVLVAARDKLTELAHGSVILTKPDAGRVGYEFPIPAYILRQHVDDELATLEADLIKKGLEIEPTAQARKG